MPQRTIEILTVGDELLRGEIVDTNASWLAGRLAELGLPVSRISSVGDARAALVAQLREHVLRADALVVSGGLGPTDDDRTTAAVAELAGLPLELDEHELAVIKQRFASIALAYTDNNAKQACFPRGATVLPNARGTAPGFALQLGRCLVCCLPGPPAELRAMFEAQLAPLLAQRLGGRPALTLRCKIFGLGEAQVDARLVGLLEAVDARGCALTLHYRAAFPEIHVTVVVASPASGDAAARMQAVAQALEAELRARLGRCVFAVGEQSFSDALVAALRAAGATLALAESCTGGLAGELITRAAGSSEVFLLSAVTYANEAKQRVLGVPAALLAEHGAVSQACVEAMARGVRALLGTTYGVAISGIAGPGGGTPDKPVGTVHFALDGPRGTRHLHRVFGYDRQRVRTVAAYVAHWLVLGDLLDADAPPAADAGRSDPLAGRWAPRAAAAKQEVNR